MNPITLTITQQDKTQLKSWITALRSGNYHQGQGTLCTRTVTDQFENEHQVNYDLNCCLGVACANAGIPRELWAVENNGVDLLRDFDEGVALARELGLSRLATTRDGNKVITIPESMSEYDVRYGFNHESENYVSIEQFLSNKNDGHGGNLAWSFAKIATWLEDKILNYKHTVVID